MAELAQKRGPPKYLPDDNMLGVRALREDYLKPAARADIPRNLRAIEERYERDAAVLEPIASQERMELPRIARLFSGGELLPPNVFFAALELSTAATINGQMMPYDPEVLALRNNLIVNYKPLAAKIRQVHAKEADEIPIRAVSNFVRSWTAFESAWLKNREVHAVQALQPLAKAILSLEPLLLSLEKERLLPWPRVQHQKVITLKSLDGFLQSFSDLAASVMPSLSRELDHDPKLLLMLDHVLSQRGEKNVDSCLDGVSATPDITYPDHKVTDRSIACAEELFQAFELIKDVLLSLKSTLEEIDPCLDKDQGFMAKLYQFERAFKKAKRLFLEPDNLA